MLNMEGSLDGFNFNPENSTLSKNGVVFYPGEYRVSKYFSSNINFTLDCGCLGKSLLLNTLLSYMENSILLQISKIGNFSKREFECDYSSYGCEFVFDVKNLSDSGCGEFYFNNAGGNNGCTDSNIGRYTYHSFSGIPFQILMKYKDSLQGFVESVKQGIYEDHHPCVSYYDQYGTSVVFKPFIINSVELNLVARSQFSFLVSEWIRCHSNLSVNNYNEDYVIQTSRRILERLDCLLIELVLSHTLYMELFEFVSLDQSITTTNQDNTLILEDTVEETEIETPSYPSVENKEPSKKNNTGGKNKTKTAKKLTIEEQLKNG